MTGAQRIAVVTLFPEIFQGFLQASLVGQAVREGLIAFEFESPREHGLGRHRSVDDTPYGGGSGMVLRVDVLVATLEALDTKLGMRPRRILLTPGGKPFRQEDARRLAEESAIVFVCGRYEGFDARIEAYVDEELSLGDFVICGGEVAAMAMTEAIVRLRPGVLGNAESVVEESHGSALLEYPHFTRPAEFRGAGVPAVLAGGNHEHIAAWRKAEAEKRTAERRPDLYAPYGAAKAIEDTRLATEKAAKRARRKRTMAHLDHPAGDAHSAHRPDPRDPPEGES